MGVRYCPALVKRWVATAGVPVRMLLNLGIFNNLLLRPTRSDQYSIGPLEVIRTAKATSKAGQMRNNNPVNTKIKSTRRFNSIHRVNDWEHGQLHGHLQAGLKGLLGLPL